MAQLEHANAIHKTLSEDGKRKRDFICDLTEEPVTKKLKAAEEPAVGCPPQMDKAQQNYTNLPNYFVFSSHKSYDIMDAIKSKVFDLLITEGQAVKRGDKIIIWKDKIGEHDSCGIVATAEVVDNPTVCTDDGNPCWTDPSKGMEKLERVLVKYEPLKTPRWRKEDVHIDPLHLVKFPHPSSICKLPREFFEQLVKDFSEMVNTADSSKQANHEEESSSYQVSNSSIQTEDTGFNLEDFLNEELPGSADFISAAYFEQELKVLMESPLSDEDTLDDNFFQNFVEEGVESPLIFQENDFFNVPISEW